MRNVYDELKPKIAIWIVRIMSFFLLITLPLWFLFWWIEWREMTEDFISNAKGLFELMIMKKL
ncbi:MAG: hypothetical protein AB7D29_07645 [Campylobacterales bacterium]